MTKYYKTNGEEWIGDHFTLANGVVKSGKGFNEDSVRLVTAEEAAGRGIEIIPHVPEKRVKKVNTKNTPTSLRKMKEQDDGGE